METQIDINNQKQIDLAAKRLAELLLLQVQFQKDHPVNERVGKENGNKN